MEQWKKNSSLLYFAGLALLVTLATAVICIGPAFARYRSESSGNIKFNVREPEQICFGIYSENRFEPITEETVLSWTKTEDGKAEMELTVANGNSSTVFSKKDQKVSIRLVSTLGIMNGTEPAKVKLVFEEEGKTVEIEGVPNLIAEGSEFYNADGEGWVFTFLRGEEEFFEVLEGNKFSAFTFKIIIDTTGTSDLSKYTILKPYAVAEIIE